MSLEEERIIYDIETLIETFNINIRESKIGCVTNDIRDNIYDDLVEIEKYITKLLKDRMVNLEIIEKKKVLAEKNVTQMVKFKKDRDDRYVKN